MSLMTNERTFCRIVGLPCILFNPSGCGVSEKASTPHPLQVSFYPFPLTCQHQNENLTNFFGDYDNFMRKRHDVKV